MTVATAVRTFDIAVLPGDGIGPEVIEATVPLLEEIARDEAFGFRFATHPAGAQHYHATGVALPPATLAAARSADAILFGAMGWPAIRYADGTEIAPQLDLRVELELYAGVRHTAVATVVLIGLLILFRRSFRRVRDIIDSRFQARITSIHIQSFEILQAERIRMLLNAFLSLSRIVIIVMLMYAYVHLVLSFFPWTRGFAHTLLDYFLVPLRVLGQALLDHVPGLFFIAVVALIARYVIKSMGLFFDQLERGAITLRNFYPEWPHPTYKLLTVGVIIFAIVVSYPYIPGSESPAFKGISIFVGVLLSLGSSSAVSNIIAGFALTYRRAFKMGDRIRIGDTVGDVIWMRVSVTHVRTIKKRFDYVETKHAIEADLVLINTCSVREKPEHKVYSALGRFKRLKEEKGTIIGVAGCVAQQEGEKLLERIPFLDMVIGTQAIPWLPQYLQKIEVSG